MKFISTRGGEKVSGAQAIVQGLAKNGGLFVPEKFPKITDKEMDEMAEMTYPQRAAFVLGKYLADDLGADYLKEICEKLKDENTSLEETALLYKEGMELAKSCREVLDNIKSELDIEYKKVSEDE